MAKQHTIAKETVFKGIGLHTGNLCTMVFRPAPAGAGITWARTDLPGSPSIKALYSNVVGVIRGTTVGDDSMRVHTIEHVMSAFYALGIDNVAVEVDANEPPVADGSSQLFYDTLLNAGLVEQETERYVLAPKERLVYTNADTEIVFEPADQLQLSTTIFFDHPLIQQQEVTVVITPDSYRREISPARTFCFDYEVEALKKQGLARGGSLDNAVVVGLDRIHNKEKKLRFTNEFVRHKTLDLLGDLLLLGCPLVGHIKSVRPGHGHNVNFVKMLAERFLKPTQTKEASLSV